MLLRKSVKPFDIHSFYRLHFIALMSKKGIQEPYEMDDIINLLVTFMTFRPPLGTKLVSCKFAIQ